MQHIPLWCLFTSHFSTNNLNRQTTQNSILGGALFIPHSMSLSGQRCCCVELTEVWGMECSLYLIAWLVIKQLSTLIAFHVLNHCKPPHLLSFRKQDRCAKASVAISLVFSKCRERVPYSVNGIICSQWTDKPSSASLNQNSKLLRKEISSNPLLEQEAHISKLLIQIIWQKHLPVMSWV